MLHVLQVAIIERKQAASTGFLAFFFNLSDVTAGNGFAAEKFFTLTFFAQRKSCLWKSGGFNFLITHRGDR